MALFLSNTEGRSLTEAIRTAGGLAAHGTSVIPNCVIVENPGKEDERTTIVVSGRIARKINDYDTPTSISYEGRYRTKVRRMTWTAKQRGRRSGIEPEIFYDVEELPFSV